MQNHLHSTLVPLILTRSHALHNFPLVFTFYFSSFNSFFEKMNVLSLFEFTFYFSSFNSCIGFYHNINSIDLHSTLVPLIRQWRRSDEYKFLYLHSTLVPLILDNAKNQLWYSRTFTFYFSSFNSFKWDMSTIKEWLFTFYFSSFNSPVPNFKTSTLNLFTFYFSSFNSKRTWYRC